MEAIVCRKEINYGGTVYRTNGHTWEVQMFGTYGPSCKGIPSYRFVAISESKVPGTVVKEQ